MYHPNLIPWSYTPPVQLLINTTMPHHPTSQHLSALPYLPKVHHHHLAASSASPNVSAFLSQYSVHTIRTSPYYSQVPPYFPTPWQWAIFQTLSLTSLSIHWVVKPPFSCQIPMVSAAVCPTATPAFSARTWASRVCILILVVSAKIDFYIPKASHYTVYSQQWSMIEWWLSNICYSKQASGVFNISSRVMRCGSRG